MRNLEISYFETLYYTFLRVQIVGVFAFLISILSTVHLSPRKEGKSQRLNLRSITRDARYIYGYVSVICDLPFLTFNY